MVAYSHLKLLPTSILNIYRVFEHIHMLFIGIWRQPYTVMAQDLGHLGHVWHQKSCHYIMVEADSHITLIPTPASMLDIYNKFEHIHMLSIGTW